MISCMNNFYIDHFCVGYLIGMPKVIDGQIGCANAYVFVQGNWVFSQGKAREFYFLTFWEPCHDAAH